jgi:hypothetical protein
MIPKIIVGGVNFDQRGALYYNNDFDASAIKRMYVIENSSTDFVRAWQGHKVEQRWFTALQGSFEIKLIAIDNWDKPSIDLQINTIILFSNSMNILQIPKGFISSIQALEKSSKLLVMSDYSFGEINDEYRFDIDYFKV